MRLHRQLVQSCGGKPLPSLLGSSGTFSKLDTRAQFPKIKCGNSGTPDGFRTDLPTVQSGTENAVSLSRGCGCGRQGRSCLLVSNNRISLGEEQDYLWSHLCALQLFPSPPLTGVEKEMTSHSSVPARRIPGMGEPGGLPSMGLHRVRHD